MADKDDVQNNQGNTIKAQRSCLHTLATEAMDRQFDIAKTSKELSLHHVFTAGNIETKAGILDRLRQIHATYIICRRTARHLGQL